MVNYKWWSSPYTWYFIALTLVIVALSMTSTDTESEWFNKLKKPPGYPPPWVFGVVWGILYPLILIGVIAAAWNGDNVRTSGITFVYTSILILTLCWIWAFFSYRELSLGAFILLATLFIVVLLLILIYPVNKWSFGIFILFGIWLSIASYYNISIQHDN